MKTLFRQGLLLLVLFVAILNSLEPPDLVEELDGMFDSPHTKYTANRAGDEGDDAMSDDTSSNPDEDKEMMDTADASHHDEDDGMGDDVSDEDKKTVEKSKIQHNSSDSKTAKGNKNDEMESKDKEGNDDAENEDKLESLPQDGSKDKEIDAKKPNKEEKDKTTSNDDKVEQLREDANKSYLEDSPKVKEVSVPKENSKQKDVSSVKPDAANNDESDSSDGKTSTKDKNNDTKSSETSAEINENTDNENDDESGIKVKNTNRKDTETLKSGSNGDPLVDKDNEKLKPETRGTSAIVKSTSKDNPDGDQTTKFKQTAGKNDHDKEQRSHGNNNRNENDDYDDDDNNINNNDGSENDKTNEDSEAQKTEEAKKSNEDEDEEHKSPTQAGNNNTNEDNQYTKVESTTKRVDNDQPELSTNDGVGNNGHENIKSEQNENSKDINQPTHTTDENMDNKATGKLKLTTGEDMVSRNTDKTSGITKNDNSSNEGNNKLPQTTNDKLAKENIDKTKLETKGSNDKSTNSDDKSDMTLSAANENDLDITKLATDKPENNKASDIGSDVKDKSKHQQQNNSPSEGSIDWVKDNEGSNPIHFDSKLKDGNDQDVRNNNKNSDEVNDMEKDEPNKKSNKNENDKADSGVHDGDIRRKVEQLSMKTGDESEEGEKPVITEQNGDGPNTVTAEDKQETRKVATQGNSGGDNDDKGRESDGAEIMNEGENSSSSQDTKSRTQEETKGSSRQERLQDSTTSDLTGTTQNMNKADVVNTLVSSTSNNEKAVPSSVNTVNVQASGDNVQENVVAETEEKSTQDGKGNVEGLLHDLVPSGILPNLPEGFAKLSEMSTVSFTYNVHENNDVTVTSDIKQPMKLFHGELEISNANLEFAYNDKEKQGQKWQFKAQGAWVNGEQEIDVILESSKHDDHFTLTGKGESLALHDYSSMFAKQEIFSKSGMNMHVFEEIMLSDIELYIVFKDFENIVSLVSGDVRVGHGTHASRCQTFIEKFPEKEPVFSILLDFLEGSPLTVLTSVMAGKIASIPYVKELLGGKGLLKVTDKGFGFAASSADVKKLRLNVFGEGMLERELGSHISSGVTLTLPVSFHSQNAVETHDIIAKISHDAISFFPTKDSAVDLTKVFKTLSEFTRPKISTLGYPEVGNLFLRELRYDVDKTVYTVLGYSTGQFNLAPGMIYLDDANLEFRQYVPNEFATLALFGSGRTNIGQARVNVTLHTDTDANELLINGEANTIWSPDIASTFGVAMEMGDDVRRILNDNRMLNMNIENARMFATVKDGESGLVHFSGHSRPISWNDAIQVEAVVFHDNLANRKRMTVGYLFDKLPLTYAIDAFSFNQFPTPRLLDNSRNTTLVLSPVSAESLFLNPAFSGLSFMQGLSLVGQFRLPDVCSLNTLCESAAQLLGTEKWYRVQGLVSSRGYTLAGYVDKEFNLAKGLKLTDNILAFTLGNYSYMSISTAMRLDKDNLSFTGYINFDPNGVRLRMTSNEVWKHPFPGKFITFDRLQIDVPLISGMAMDELLATGELNFGVPGSLYRIFAPAYLTFTPSKPKQVGFQATMANITLETITSALNFKPSLPGVLLNSRFPDTLVARYTPDNKKDEDLELYGKLDILSRTLICKLHIDKNTHITATTSHSKFPLILDDGLITVYADQQQPRLGPRAWFTVTPESTKFKLEGFANFMGLGKMTKIDVSESGTEFSLTGNLFDVTKTVVSFMSPDSLPENGPYFASACLPSIIPHVTTQVNLLLAAAADQAQRYMKQASANYNQATMYHKQALVDERKQILIVDERENDIENDDREMFLAEERYNKTCWEEQCEKTCIGCTSWLKCCDRDVFGNCVKCPGWKACCWHGKSPICKARNHACRIMKQIAAENLQKIARRVYADKEKKRAKEKVLWNSEFMKGKTQAVLDAARRALHLVSHDSRVGLGAAESIKRFGLERLVNIKSVCFHTTLKTLATSCVTMRINITFANEDEMQSLPYYGCLNRELVSKMANHIAHFMFRDQQNEKVPPKQAEGKPKPGRRRSGRLFGKPLEEEQVDLTTSPPGNTYIMRKRRGYDALDDDMESRPFWLIRNNYQPHVPSFLQQRTTVPHTPLKKKWQIPASKKGKCKVYRQLVEICKDMMATVKKMFESYEDGKEKYHKRLTELQLGLNTTIYDLEKQVMDNSELLDRLPDIEMNIRTVGTGVNQWKINCEADQDDQNKIAIQEWVSTMEGRIRKLGGQGVDRFLSNLFRAFEGMFLGTETPKHSAQKVLNTLQAIREISATFHDIFGNNEITLEKANSRAEIVMTKLKQIKDAQMFCDD